MVNALKIAFKKAEELSSQEQELLASLILDEMKWATTFSKSQSILSNLANEALGEFKSGKTKEMNF